MEPPQSHEARTTQEVEVPVSVPVQETPIQCCDGYQIDFSESAPPSHPLLVELFTPRSKAGSVQGKHLLNSPNLSLCPFSGTDFSIYSQLMANETRGEFEGGIFFATPRAPSPFSFPQVNHEP